MGVPRRIVLTVLIASGVLYGCASTKAGSEDSNQDIITREQILGTGATNLFDVVNRLRPRWLQVRTVSSFSLADEVVVFQDRMQLGGPEALRQIGPELAFQIEWMDGTKAASALPGLMSGRHIQGAIIVHTRPHEGR
jgi:hypothetical protein